MNIVVREVSEMRLRRSLADDTSYPASKPQIWIARAICLLGTVTLGTACDRWVDAGTISTTQAVTEQADGGPVQDPSIADLTSQSTAEDSPLDVPIPVVGYVGGPLPCTTALVATSSNEELVDSQGLSFSGTLPDCSMRLSPKLNQQGTSTITIEMMTIQNEAQASFEFTVEPVNDVPILRTPGDTKKVTSQKLTTQIALATGEDPDTNTDQQNLRYELRRKPASGFLGDFPSSAVSGGMVLYTREADFVGSDSFVYQICDNFKPPSCTDPITMELTFIRINESPTDIVISNSTVLENAPENTSVGDLATIDPDGESGFTYTLAEGTGDTDNAAFNFNGSSLRLNSSADFEAQKLYSIRVRTTDNGGPQDQLASATRRTG